MVFMPGDNRARDAYDDWCTAMGGTDAGGQVLPRWEFLTPQEHAAWEGTVESVGAAAVGAFARMNAPAAGLHGAPASGTAGVHGYPASAHGMPGVVHGAAVSAIPSMMP